MNENKELMNEIDELKNINQKLRNEIESMVTKQSRYVRRTIKVFEMFGIKPKDAMKKYVELERQEKESNG